MHLTENLVDAQILRHRNATDQLLEPIAGQRARLEFVNPGPDAAVLAEDFLSHLDLDVPSVNAILKDAYPDLDRIPGLKRSVHARVRFYAWMTLRRYANLAAAHRDLQEHADVGQRLDFGALPAYDTLRECFNDRLGEEHWPRLKAAILAEEKRLLPSLGQVQSEDATPLVARRRDEEAPWNGHYKARMRKLELRWDAPHEALLADQYAPGASDEEPYLRILTDRLGPVGIHAESLYVDNGYTSFQTHAHEYRRGTRLVHRPQDDWAVCEPVARAEVEKRIQIHWTDDGFPVEGSWDARVGFLYDRGSDADRDAVGRWVRDRMLSERTPEEAATLREHRSQNEALNAEAKRLPLDPLRRGGRCQYLRVLACTVTLHLVQLTRLQNGVKTRLCRTTHLV